MKKFWSRIIQVYPYAYATGLGTALMHPGPGMPLLENIVAGLLLGTIALIVIILPMTLWDQTAGRYFSRRDTLDSHNSYQQFRRRWM